MDHQMRHAWNMKTETSLVNGIETTNDVNNNIGALVHDPNFTISFI